MKKNGSQGEKQEKKSTEDQIESTTSSPKMKRKRLIRILSLSAAGLVLSALLFLFVFLPMIKYNHASNLLIQKQYDEAITIFESLGDYRDSKVMVKEATYQKANDLLLNKEYDEAIVIFTGLEDYKDSKDLIKEANYLKAKALLINKEFDEAIEIFTGLEDYKDSEEMGKEANYQKANALLVNKEYDAAIALFTSLPGYKDSEKLMDEARYLLAVKYLEEGKYYYASEIFQELGEYEDSPDLFLQSNYSQAKLYYQLGLFDLAKSLFDTMPTYEDSPTYLGLLQGLINIQGTWEVVSGDRQHVFIGWKYFMVDDPYGENIITEGTLEESYISEDLIRFTTYVTGYFVNFDVKNNLFNTEFFVYGSQKWGFKTYSVIEEYKKINLYTINLKIFELMEPDLLTLVETYPYLADLLLFLPAK